MERIGINPKYRSQERRFEAILIGIFLLTIPFANPWVRGDGVGYYAYARAPLIEHSLDFTHDYQSANASFREARCDENLQPKPEYRTRTGHLDNHFSVGPAILWSPFLMLAHAGVLSVRIAGFTIKADGFSAPYRYAMAIGTCLYGFLGLWLSFRLARRHVAPIWAFIATLAVWWASSLPVYMYFNPSWSHAHSAFVAALFLLYWDATRGNRSFRQWLILGAIVGLMLDVYYLNLMMMSVLIVEGVRQCRDILRSEDCTANLRVLSMQYLLFGFVVLLVMIPTFASRLIVYGSPFASNYPSFSEYLWRSPVFLNVLFSSNHGLLAWTPLLGFSIIGLFLLAFRLPEIGLPLVTAVLTFYLFISFYPDWAGIASFGNRFFISLTALWILGLAYLLERVARHFELPRRAIAVLSGALVCFALWNVGLIYQWGTHLVPARGPVSFRKASYNQFCVVPFEIASHLRSYFFRRSDLMQQIERRDIEQQKDLDKQFLR